MLPPLTIKYIFRHIDKVMRLLTYQTYPTFSIDASVNRMADTSIHAFYFNVRCSFSFSRNVFYKYLDDKREKS